MSNPRLVSPSLARARRAFAPALALLLLWSLGSVFPVRAGIQAGQLLRVAYPSDPQGFDPALYYHDLTWQVAVQVMETLAAYEPGGSDLVPRLATSWSVAADNLTWTFDIRPGVTFHDGTPLDAAAVAYNFQRWWDPAHPFHDADFALFSALLGGLKGDPGCLIADITTAGGSLVITLTAPRGDLPAILALPAFAIASPASIQAGSLDLQPVGSGPFSFGDWVANDHILLETYADYWGQVSQLAGIEYRWIPLEEDRLAALQHGSVDFSADMGAGLYNQVAMDPRLAPRWRPAVAEGHLGINRAHAPLDILKVRQAIAYAIDLDALIAAHYSPGDRVANQMIPGTIWGGNPAVSRYPYDPQKARDLLAEAGFPDGFSTTLSLRDVQRFYLPDPTGTAQAIQAYLHQVGIQAQIQVLESGAFIDAMNNGELDLFLIGWSPDYLHPHDYYWPQLCDGYLAYGDKDLELCDHLQQALIDPDQVDQATFYAWVSQRIHDTLPLVPLAHARRLVIARPAVRALVPSPLNLEEFSPLYFESWLFLPMMEK